MQVFFLALILTSLIIIVIINNWLKMCALRVILVKQLKGYGLSSKINGI